MFKPWRVNAVVSALQFALGVVMYWWFGSVAIAAATVGFCTFVALFPVTEGVIPEYCAYTAMEKIVVAAVLAAFAIALAAVAVRIYLRTNSYLGWDFFSSAAFMIMALLLVIVALAFVYITTLYYMGIDRVREPPSVSIVCLLPAGIGLLFGAFYFSMQYYRRRAAT